MSAKLSLAALAILAVATFKENSDIQKVFATADGNIFLPGSENHARNHGRQEKLEVYTITRAEALATDADAGEGEDDSADKEKAGTAADA